MARTQRSTQPRRSPLRKQKEPFSRPMSVPVFRLVLRPRTADPLRDSAAPSHALRTAHFAGSAAPTPCRNFVGQICDRADQLISRAGAEVCLDRVRPRAVRRCDTQLDPVPVRPLADLDAFVRRQVVQDHEDRFAIGPASTNRFQRDEHVDCGLAVRDTPQSPSSPIEQQPWDCPHRGACDISLVDAAVPKRICRSGGCSTGRTRRTRNSGQETCSSRARSDRGSRVGSWPSRR